jgi:hypothetical protein
MGSLAETISDPTRRKAVVADCAVLIDSEVADKRGLSGAAIKAGYRSVKGLRPDMITRSMDHLLDDFSRQVDPFWQDCQAKGEDPRRFFVARKGEVANALLQITDDRAAKSDHKTLVRVYKGLRGKAVDHIGAAMPRFADLLAKHAG